MQVNHIDTEQLADLLHDAKILQMLDYCGQRTYVLEFDQQDILAIDNLSGGAVVIYPCTSFDQESGGSLHDNARAITDAV